VARVPRPSSLVIPCFREEDRLPACVAGLRAALDQAQDWDVVLACERSPDRTLEVARREAASDPRFRAIDTGPQRGKGWAVRAGLAACRGGIAGFTDCDLNVPAPEVVAAFTALQHAGPDVLAADRTLPGSRVVRAAGGLRPLQGRLFRAVVASLGLCPVRDTQCGLKVMRRAVVDDLLPRLQVDGFAFDVELLALASQRGWRVQPLAVTWRAGEGRSRVVPWRDGARMVASVLELWIRMRRGPAGHRAA
jgi:dolichyl-phosphate beta-glucosyltransferase